MSPWRFTFLGYQLGLAKPLYLGLTLAAAGVALLALIIALQRASRVSRVIPTRFAQILAPGVSLLRPLLHALFYGAGLFFLAIALSQPQCGSRSELTKRRGIDVVVALDASKSMLARDVEPSRLDRAKLELGTLLDELKGDRIGIVVFAGDAFIQCPLTSDYAAAKMFLRAVDPQQMPQGGTNIGAALSLSKQLLDNAERGAKERLIVLLSDGEDLTGDIEEALDGLKEGGIRVLAVGIGSEQGEPTPVLNRRGESVGHKKDERGDIVLTRLNLSGLREIANATGGEVFHQTKSVAVEEVIRRIDSMQKSELESRVTVRYAEGYQYFLGVGLTLLFVGIAIRASKRRPA
jgi:Ca-activated chloride channel family protein